VEGEAAMTKPKKRGRGRPKKIDGPAFPRVEVDRLLVHGEVVMGADGKPADVHHPTHKEVADMFGVTRAMISHYSKTHNCARRRKQAMERLYAKVERDVLEARSTAMALRKEDELRIIDTYLRGFEESLEEGRVRFDTPSDFNMMIRLKNFINGGADTRQEIHTTLSLEEIQTRHKQTLRAQRTGAVVRGEISSPADEVMAPSTPSADSSRSTSQELHTANRRPAAEEGQDAKMEDQSSDSGERGG